VKFISEFKSVNFFTLDLWNSLVNFPHKRFHLRTYPPHMLSSTSTRRSYHRNVQRGPALPNRRPQLAFLPSSDEDENVSDGGWVSVQATSSAANPATNAVTTPSTSSSSHLRRTAEFVPETPLSQQPQTTADKQPGFYTSIPHAIDCSLEHTRDK